VAILANREERANAILSYYNNLQTYNTQTDADGTDTDGDKPQGQFKAFNDLIKLHHDELKVVTGYASAAIAYLPSEESTIDTTEWWYNANRTNLRASMFFTDSNYLNNRNAIYAANALSIPNQKHPYVYWNQYLSEFGTWNDFGYINAAPGFTYTDTMNPFETGANYRLKEPLEYYGDSDNLLWGRIIHNGKWSYRVEYCADSSYSSVADTGFNDYTTSGKTLHNLLSGQSASNEWPSPFEIMRYTYWGTGSEGSAAAKTISLHSGTTSGTFEVAASSQFTPDTWYIFYHATTTTEGWVLRVGTESGVGPYQWTYTGAYWPTPTSGDFDGTRQCATNPYILGSEKTTPPGNGRENVWNSVYSQYYSSKFETALDGITTQATAWSTALGDFATFDYTVINAEAGSTFRNFIEVQAAAAKTDVDAWIIAWKSLINDTGSGATYTQNDSDWSNASLDGLFTNGSGGLDLVISFASTSYTSTQSGYIADRRDEIYDDILGAYNKHADEDWNPSLESFVDNNTGYLDSGKLYAYRHNFIDSRLNKESGTLTISRNAYYTSLDKLEEISQLEIIMAPVAPESKYDITPIDFELSIDEEDKIVIDWEDSKAASSYDIQRKDGVNGSWATIETNYDYTDPGDPPDFEATPQSRYEDAALTQGYQEFGLSFSSEDDGTGLNEDFTIYDFNIDVDSAGVQTINLKGLDCKTYEALRVAMQDELDDEGLETTVTIETDDIRIISNKRGDASTIAITSGPINDLFTALSTTPDTAVEGVTQLEQGKIYYYMVKVNNGYNVVLGSDGNTEDKDWDSQSEWQIDEYSNDRAIHGDFGYVVWDSPENLMVSGVDEGVTASDAYCRLEWDIVLNAVEYKIYRATSLDGGYAYIDTTVNTYYEDTTGISGFIYYYKLKAVANSEYQEYDEDGNFTGALESLITDEGVRGKKLWIGLTLAASDDDIDKTTLTWNILSGANGYLLYTSDLENGQYSYLVKDDATDLILTGNSYVDERPAKQFFDRQFESPTDGLTDTEYEINTRYYFQILGTTEAYEYAPTIEEYWITSPNSGVWTAQAIADSIQDALSDGLNNSVCELVYMENPSPYYAIRISSVPIGVDASVILKDGSLEISLLDILPVAPSEPGDGAYSAMYRYYKLQAVEVIIGEIVRSSELTDVAIGYRPLDLPKLE